MTTHAPDGQLTGEGLQIRLLRAGEDVVELSPAQLSGLKQGKDTLVWLDATVADGGIAELTDVLGTLYGDAASLGPLLETTSAPGVEDREDLVRVEVIGLDADHDFVPRDVICIVGEGWVATTHETDVQFVAEFSKALEGPSEAGALDAPAFLAVLLGWQIQSYRAAVDDVIRQIDKLDDDLLKPGWNGEKLIVPMVQIRRRISRLRRVLAPHRLVYHRLASPELDRLSTSESAASFKELADETGDVAEAVQNAREMLLGSFEILNAQATERTNNVMKTLTFVSILLLPSTLIAGVMGMNFKAGLFEHPSLFYVTLAFMFALMLGGLFLAWHRGWIGMGSAFDVEVAEEEPGP